MQLQKIPESFARIRQTAVTSCLMYRQQVEVASSAAKPSHPGLPFDSQLCLEVQLKVTDAIGYHLTAACNSLLFTRWNQTRI